MIRRILAELRKRPATLAELSRRLGIERSALKGMLEHMVRRGTVREVHPVCGDKGCRGCSFHGRCHTMPVTGYQAVEPGGDEHA